MQKKYVLAVNPIAGGTDKTEWTEKIVAFAKQANIDLTIFETTGKDDEDQLKSLLEKEHAERLIVAGGDGTIKMAADVLCTFDIPMGIIPAGSANGLTVDLNFPADEETLLQTAFFGTCSAIDMVSINGKKSLHLSDLGLNAELINNYEEGSVRGKLGYALHAFTTLFESGDPFPVSIKTKGKEISCRAKMVVIANSRKYGTGVVINPKGDMDDGLFEIVIMKTLSPVLLAKIVSGKMPDDSDEIEIISTDNAEIVAGRPVAFQIDGEYCGEETKLSVHILPKHLKVAMPAAIEQEPSA